MGFNIFQVAILMTLEGEYYRKSVEILLCGEFVAILMTLEGEYYLMPKTQLQFGSDSRNPHDIGRRILRILNNFNGIEYVVAILMTLEGEYYWEVDPRSGTERCRNPHDIGRRILLDNPDTLAKFWAGRNPHDIGRRILRLYSL